MSKQRVHDLARKVKRNVDAVICAAACESDLSEAALDLHVQLMIDIDEILVLSAMSTAGDADALVKGEGQ